MSIPSSNHSKKLVETNNVSKLFDRCGRKGNECQKVERRVDKTRLACIKKKCCAPYASAWSLKKYKSYQVTQKLLTRDESLNGLTPTSFWQFLAKDEVLREKENACHSHINLCVLITSLLKSNLITQSSTEKSKNTHYQLSMWTASNQLSTFDVSRENPGMGLSLILSILSCMNGELFVP